MGARRARLLARLPADRRLRRVLAAYAICVLVEFATWLAILLEAYERSGPALVGIASVVMLVPAILLVPLLASIGDRMPRGRALSLGYVVVALTSLLGAVPLAVGAPFGWVLLPGAALSVAISLVRPWHYAALPLLANRARDLVAANSLSSFLEGGTVFAGFVLAGVLTQQAGAWVVLAAAGVLALVGAGLTRGLGLPTAAIDDGDRLSEMRAALHGFVTLRGQTGVIALLLLLAMLSVLEGANDTLTVTWNDQVLGAGASTAGVLAGAYGLGIALASAVQAGVHRRRHLAGLILSGAILFAVAAGTVSLLGSLLPAVLAMTVCGIGLSMVNVSSRTLLQRSTDNAVLARVMAIEEGVRLVGLTLGAVVGPVLVVWLGPRWAFVAVPVAVLLLVLVSAPRVRRLDVEAEHRPRELALLGEVSFLAALAPYERERLAQSAHWRHVAAGATVVTQGEVGDTYWIVASGELSVTVDGRLRPHRLGPGNGFGEIALLNGGPRTATVTALVDCRLMTLDREAFLAAVTSSVDGSVLVTGVARGWLDADRRAAGGEDENVA